MRRTDLRRGSEDTLRSHGSGRGLGEGVVRWCRSGLGGAYVVVFVLPRDRGSGGSSREEGGRGEAASRTGGRRRKGVDRRGGERRERRRRVMILLVLPARGDSGLKAICRRNVR